MIGFPLGSYLDGLYGWRMAFILIGIPGVIFAIIFFLTVKEPQRRQGVDKTSEVDNTSFKSVFKYLLSKKSFVFLALAAGCHTFATYGLGNWLASFIVRLHLPTGGIEASNIGITIGLILGFAGGAGSFIGGYFADKLGKADKTWYFKVSAYGGIIAIPFLLVFYFHSDTVIALTCLFIGYTAISTFLGPAIAITHSIVPAKMRAFSSSVLFLALNLIGLGFGPLFVGFISDVLEPSLGVESLRWAMASTVFMTCLAVYLFMKASKYIDEDLKTT